MGVIRLYSLCAILLIILSIELAFFYCHKYMYFRSYLLGSGWCLEIRN